MGDLRSAFREVLHQIADRELFVELEPSADSHLAPPPLEIRVKWDSPEGEPYHLTASANSATFEPERAAHAVFARMRAYELEHVRDCPTCGPDSD